MLTRERRPELSELIDNNLATKEHSDGRLSVGFYRKRMKMKAKHDDSHDRSRHRLKLLLRTQ